jgi:hypothetical protein
VQQLTTFPRPPSSPDLALCDFFLFLKTTFKLKGRRYAGGIATRDEEADVTAATTGVPEHGNPVKPEVDCFEGDGG